MVYDQLVSHFVTPSRAAFALGVDRRLVDGWKKRRIPTKHQLHAEKLSGGVLVPDEKAKKEAAELTSILQPESKAA
jgi:hypothetical protein